MVIYLNETKGSFVYINNTVRESNTYVLNEKNIEKDIEDKNNNSNETYNESRNVSDDNNKFK